MSMHDSSVPMDDVLAAHESRDVRSAQSTIFVPQSDNGDRRTSEESKKQQQWVP